MATENTGQASAQPAAEELQELRRAMLELGKALKTVGTARLSQIGDDVADEARVLADEGRRMLHDIERRIGQIEKRAEKSLLEHPGAWATGLLGVIGFGLVLGLILRSGE